MERQQGTQEVERKTEAKGKQRKQEAKVKQGIRKPEEKVKQRKEEAKEKKRRKQDAKRKRQSKQQGDRKRQSKWRALKGQRQAIGVGTDADATESVSIDWSPPEMFWWGEQMSNDIFPKQRQS